MHDLARAYEIPVKSDGTKNEILPAMITAEQDGIFRTHPKHPYYFEKARRDPDKRAEPLHNPEMDRPLTKSEAKEVAEGEPVEKPKKVRKPSGYNLLQKEAKSLGLNCWGMKTPELAKAIENAKQRKLQTGE